MQSTLVGQVGQVLSQMGSVRTQQEFIAACIRGFTANCTGDKTALVSKIFDKFKEKSPVSLKEALILYAENKAFRTFITLPSEFTLEEICSEKGAVLQTAAVQSYIAVLRGWV